MHGYFRSLPCWLRGGHCGACCRACALPGWPSGACTGSPPWWLRFAFPCSCVGWSLALTLFLKSYLLSSAALLLLAQEPKAQISKDKTWHCKPCCYNCYNEITCYTVGENLTNHPMPYGIGPGRARRGVCEIGHGIRKANGRKRQGAAWTTAGTLPNGSTVSKVRWKNARPSLTYAAPSAHRWGT